MKIVFCCFFPLIFLVFSCKNREQKGEESAQNSRYQYLEAAADSSWLAMMRSDDAKIGNMQRLISELLLIEGSDSLRLTSIRRKTDSLTAFRYDRITMAEKGKIDCYDSLSTAAIESLKKEISLIPKARNYQIVNQLNEEIVQADDSVLFYRKGYDSFIDGLNELRKKSGAQENAAGGSAGEQKPLPVFRLVP